MVVGEDRPEEDRGDDRGQRDPGHRPVEDQRRLERPESIPDQPQDPCQAEREARHEDDVFKG